MAHASAYGRSRRCALAATFVVAEIAALACGLTPGAAQFWDDRFFQNQRPSYRQRQQPANPFGGPSWFEPQPDVQRARPQEQDFSRAPAPKKTDQTPTTTVMVLGDSMADWLAYGLEGALSENTEIGVVRRHKTLSGLIRQDVRSDPRGEHPDYPQYVRQLLAAEKPDFVVMMLGINDRRPIRDRPAARPADAKPGDSAKPSDAAKTDNKDAKPGAKPDQKPDETAESAAPETLAPQGTGANYEFRSEKWAELYIRRIDETTAALKSRGVPVIWVGLPPVRGTRSMSEMTYLNELYRGRAEKAGIAYVDVWDGFIDESGRFAVQGPDFEGQIRRLRASDGAYFTAAGARKLAHYVDREIQRSLASRTITVSLPAPEAAPAPAAQPAAKTAAPGATPRPLSGAVIPLGGSGNDDDGELLGKAAPRQTVEDPLALQVMAKGEFSATPAGRADDAAWPRRTIAPLGADPVVAMTTRPVREIQQTQRSATNASSTVTVSLAQPAERSAAAEKPAERAKPRRPRPVQAPREQANAWGQPFGFFGQPAYTRQQTQIRIEPRRPPPAFTFPSFW